MCKMKMRRSNIMTELQRSERPDVMVEWLVGPVFIDQFTCRFFTDWSLWTRCVFCTKRHETEQFIITTQIHLTDGFIRLVTEIQTKSISTVSNNMINTVVRSFTGCTDSGIRVTCPQPTPSVQVLYFTTLLWQLELLYVHINNTLCHQYINID